MARNYKRYNRAKSWYNRRAGNMRNTYYSSPRFRRFRKTNEAIGIYNPGMAYLAGVGVGFTDLDNKIPAEIKLILACLPLRGGIGGELSRLARGMVFGDVVSSKIGFQLNLLGGGSSNIVGGNV